MPVAHPPNFQLGLALCNVWRLIDSSRARNPMVAASHFGVLIKWNVGVWS